MRWRLLALTGAFLLVLALAAPAGATNPQTAGLQVALRAYGLYFGPIDGIVGPQTVAAVRVFQRAHGLPVDGLAGARTRRALGPLGRPLFGTRQLGRGAFGWDVAVLEFLLAQAGRYRGALDGYYGAEVQRAVRRFQGGVQLVPDGIVGRATLAALGLRWRIPMTHPARRYRVRPGDTLGSIALRFGTTVAALARLNGLRPGNVLPAGIRLRLPEEGALTASSADIRDELDHWAGRYGVDRHLARALAWMESGYQTDVTSPVGAWGVLQILPITWRYAEDVLLGRRVPHTPSGNIQIGIAYLRHLLRASGGDERMALATWFQGPRSVRDRGISRETKHLVADVLALRERL